MVRPPFGAPHYQRHRFAMVEGLGYEVVEEAEGGTGVFEVERLCARDPTNQYVTTCLLYRLARSQHDALELWHGKEMGQAALVGLVGTQSYAVRAFWNGRLANYALASMLTY